MYWPNQRAMKLDVPEVATVGDSVRLALQAHKDRETGDSEAKVYHDHPYYYELRMYDEDEGEPDYDGPRLDNDRKLKSFGDDCYCICEIKSKILRHSESPLASSVPQWQVEKIRETCCLTFSCA